MNVPKIPYVSLGCVLILFLHVATAAYAHSYESRFKELIRESDTLGIIQLLNRLDKEIAEGSVSMSAAAGIYSRMAKASFGYFPARAKYLVDRSDYYAQQTGDSALLLENKFIHAEQLMEEDDRARAIVLLDEIFRIYLSKNDSASVLKALRLLGNNYDYLGDHPAALDYYQQCILLAEKLGNNETLSRVYGNIAGIYGDEREYYKSIETYEKALPIARASGNYTSLFNIYQGLGIIYQDVELYDEAYANLEKCRKVGEENGDIRLEGFALQSFGFYFLELERLDSAEYYMLRTMAIAQKINNSQLYFNALEALQEICYKSGRYKEAYDYYVKMDQGEDSIYTLQNAKLIESVKSQYQTERKERELAEKNLLLTEAEYDLQQNFQLQNGLVILLVMLLVIIFLIYRGYVLRKRANDLLKARTAESESYSRKIEEINETKSRWFINVAHELRTPLTLIKGPVKRLIDRGDLHQDGLEDLKMVQKNADQLVEIVNEILDLSRLEEGKIVLEAEVVSIRELIDDVFSAFDPTAEYEEIALKNEIPDDLYLMVDHDKLKKLFVNLISNAFKYSTRQGEITVTSEVGSEVKLAVNDTGAGITPEDLSHVFDRFYQSGGHRRSLQGGTGIGLALSREIAEMHGGTLSAESVLQKGSTFTLILPKKLICDAYSEDHIDDQESAETETSDPLGLIKEKPQLLLVEDNVDMRKFVGSLLEKEFQIVECKNGHEGLEKLTTHKIRMIISDVMMPGMNGTTFLREVKAASQWSKLPFVHLSALTDHEVKKEAFRIGIDEYLQKPFDPEELIVRVKNLYHNYLNRIGEEVEDEVISHDDKIIKKLKDEVLSNLDDCNFNVWRLADSGAMSERQVYRFLRKATGLTPHQFIQEIKLSRAMEMIEKKMYQSVGEISSAVGFQNPAYFSTVFEKRYGRKPASFIRS